MGRDFKKSRQRSNSRKEGGVDQTSGPPEDTHMSDIISQTPEPPTPTPPTPPTPPIQPQPSDMELQRDAALEELKSIKEQMSKLSAELDETKKTNYRLAMSGASAPTMSFDDALVGLLGLQKGD